MSDLNSVYDPHSYELEIIQLWESKGIFNARAQSEKPHFTILMPPPNVTSQLHMGHGTGYSIQDLLIRWKRMSGFEACWLPGTDHAGIATQMMVEKSLLNEGLTRQELGREKFLERLQDWKTKYGGLILDQLRRMGFSCDWSRVAYTMDPKLSEAVRYTFVTLFEEGLIYQGERLVNWDIELQTALSDDEVVTEEIQGALYTIKYPIVDSDEFIPVATTRPETMFGDTAVAVNPGDDRYAHLIGRKVRLPLQGRVIPIIGDDYVKSDFGTGALKITPAHDPNDFEIGKRHTLPSISVLDDRGHLCGAVPEPFLGLERFKGRKKVVEALKQLDLLQDEKAHRHAVPHSERSKTVIEPKLSKQWFVRMEALAKPAAEAARSDEIRFYPESWKKTYLYWLDNIQDWCISRQLWWGHRIPIWYCSACNGVTTGLSDPSACTHCGSKEIRQDEDVLDTWFSSWLWPMSPFGWPDNSATTGPELSAFYPSNVLVTAPEIIFLWVARMIMAGLKFKGRPPFKDVYFNATVCDKKGRKFSKTLGNGIDPLDVITKHGADAVRFTALSLAPLGGRVRMDIGDFEHGARFINKVWNAARFVLRHTSASTKLTSLKDLHLSLSEQWLLHEFDKTALKIDRLLNAYRLNEAVEEMYHFVWGSYCDWALECAKDQLGGTDHDSQEKSLNVLIYVLDGFLRLAHPIIPFVTEKIWQGLPPHPDWDRPHCLAVACYPKGSESTAMQKGAKSWETVQDIVSGIRSARQQSGLPPNVDLAAHIKASLEVCRLVDDNKTVIKRLANIKEIKAAADLEKPPKAICHVGSNFELYLPVEGVLDVAKERARLQQEELRIKKIVAGYDAKLRNEDFVKNAPPEVVDQTRQQHNNMTKQLDSISRNLQSLNN